MKYDPLLGTLKIADKEAPSDAEGANMGGV